MKPVTQTRVYPEVGNCLEAALASVVECPIEEVPDLTDDTDWVVRIADWLLARGFTLRCTGPDEISEGWHIAVGPSPRAKEWHAVVVEDGQLRWDPHPARTFFDGAPIRYFLVIERLMYPVKKAAG